MDFIVKESILSFYFSAICVFTWLIYLIFWSPLIWDAMINIVYLILDVYSIYYWLNPSKAQKSAKNKIADTRHLTILEYFLYVVIAFIAVSVMTYIGITYGRYYNTLQALTDSTTTIIAIFAKYLTSRKILQSWYLWILVSLISIPLYISIHSYTLAMLWFLYGINGVHGLIVWNRNMKN